MSQQRIIRQAVPTPSGWAIDIEVTNAYTDGTSRFDRVYVSRNELRGKSAGQRRQAIKDALDDAPLEGIEGALVNTPQQTKDILEDRMKSLYEDWQRWKATRVEAQERAVAANVITALTNREDAAWAKYVVTIQAWRSA